MSGCEASILSIGSAVEDAAQVSCARSTAHASDYDTRIDEARSLTLQRIGEGNVGDPYASLDVS